MASRVLTQEVAVKELVDVHGDKYDYSLVKYTATKEKIDIVCSTHGVFSQRYASHKKGLGCQLCGKAAPKRTYTKDFPTVYGVGYKPFKSKTHGSDGRITKEYNLWFGMMTRAYNPKYHEKKPSYENVTVCDEWLWADNFSDWCQDQVGYKVEGFQLDKDILFKGNTVYSPSTCVFVPAEVNSQLTKANSRRGDYPIGVSWHSQHEKFMACFRYDKKTQHLGYFECQLKAFEAYKKAKEAYLVVLANKYRDVIDSRCYDALCKYEVEVTD